MTIVRGYSELVLRGTDSDYKTRELVQRILTNADTLNGLLDELLTVFRCDAGKMRVTPTLVPLRAEVALVAEAFAHAARKKGLDFRCDYREPVPTALKVDVLLLRRILGNVLENAVKYTAAGAITVDVAYAHGQLVFRIGDSGPGIPPELALKLFEPYQQRAEPAGRSGGTGLGLSVVRRLCRAMGGDALLEHSSAESGSVFRLFMIAEAENLPCANPREP